MNKDQQSKLEQEVRKSEEARQLLDNKLLKESFINLKNTYQKSLFQTGVNEHEAREKLWLAYNIVEKVESNLAEIVNTGKLASKQLQDYKNQIKSKL